MQDMDGERMPKTDVVAIGSFLIRCFMTFMSQKKMTTVHRDMNMLAQQNFMILWKVMVSP